MRTHSTGQGVGVWGLRCAQHWGVRGPSGEIRRQAVPSSLWVGFLMESAKWLVEWSFRCPPRARAAFSQPPPPPTGRAAHPAFWMRGEREVGRLPYSWGSQTLTPTLSPPPWEEIAGERGSLGSGLCAGGGVTGKVTLVLFIASNLGFCFAPTVCWNFAGVWDSHKGALIRG